MITVPREETDYSTLDYLVPPSVSVVEPHGNTSLWGPPSVGRTSLLHYKFNVREKCAGLQTINKEINKHKRGRLS